MVTLTDRCSSRCNLVFLFHTRVLSAFWRTKDVFESHLIATAGSANVVLKISQIILINDLSSRSNRLKLFEIGRVSFLSVGFVTRVTFEKHLRR